MVPLRYNYMIQNFSLVAIVRLSQDEEQRFQSMEQVRVHTGTNIQC
jgi:hypothetical protein